MKAAEMKMKKLIMIKKAAGESVKAGSRLTSNLKAWRKWPRIANRKQSRIKPDIIEAGQRLKAAIHCIESESENNPRPSVT